MSTFQGKSIALLGSEGSGMRGLGILLAAEGAKLVRIDKKPHTLGVLTEEEGIAHFEDLDFVIHSDALVAEHLLLVAAKDRGVPTLPYHKALGRFAEGKRTVAITGTHGKSSTTAMVAHIFVAAGLDPTVLIGAANPAWDGEHARVGKGPYFIVEADEYRNHFHSLRPESAIITSIDFDHPDFFASLTAVTESFSTFIHNIVEPGVVVVSADVQQRFPSVAWPAPTSAVELPSPPIDVVLPGEHMQRNAALALALAHHYGIPEKKARHALRSFPGLGRRFEIIGSVEEMIVVSDYGHHPTEIAATLQAARTRYADTKVCVIFEAHTTERLETFREEFIQALAIANGVVIVQPYVPPGRSKTERDTAQAHLAHIQQELTRRGVDVMVLTEKTALATLLATLALTYGVTIGFSAGELDRELRSAVKDK